MDTIWYHLQSLKSPVGNISRLKVARIVLLVPHSNAGIERFYSLVNKNKNEGSERNRIEIDGSISSILTVSKNVLFQPSKQLLHVVKRLRQNRSKKIEKKDFYSFHPHFSLIHVEFFQNSQDKRLFNSIGCHFL